MLKKPDVRAISDFTWLARAPSNSLSKTQVHIVHIAMETLSCQTERKPQEWLSSSIQIVTSVPAWPCVSTRAGAHTCTHRHTPHTSWEKHADAHPLDCRFTWNSLFQKEMANHISMKGSYRSHFSFDRWDAEEKKRQEACCGLSGRNPSQFPSWLQHSPPSLEHPLLLKHLKSPFPFFFSLSESSEIVTFLGLNKVSAL